MKRRKLPRAKPMQSIRHGLRRAAKPVWLQQFRDNPANHMTDQQLREYDRALRGAAK